MAFNGTEGGEIALQNGARMTADYRSQNPNDTKAHFFGKDILNDLLSQEGCMGIRMYHGLDENGMKQLILVGSDCDENDILNMVVDLSLPCPTRCPSSNPLNS